MSRSIKKLAGSVFCSLLLMCIGITNAFSWEPGCGPNGPGCGNSVPELDGAMGPIAMALLAGVIGIGLERRRRKNKL